MNNSFECSEKDDDYFDPDFTVTENILHDNTLDECDPLVYSDNDCTEVENVGDSILVTMNNGNIDENS